MTNESSSDHRPLVSIVIPVYNGAPFLRQCLDTVVGQTYDKLEILVVDDGSTDESPAILYEYARQDKRITLLASDHGGGGAARNVGLRSAHGSYIVFLDCDDVFVPELVEHCLDRALAADADLVIYDAVPFDSRTGAFKTGTHYLYTHKRAKAILETLGGPDAVFSRHDAPNDILSCVAPAPWLRFIRRQFLIDEGLEFQEIANSNDYCFGHLTLSCARRIVVLDERLVQYRINNATSTQGGKSKKAACVLQAVDGLRSELMRRGIYEEIRRSFLEVMYSTIAVALRTLDIDGRTILLDTLDSTYPELLALVEAGLPDGYPEGVVEFSYLVQSAVRQYRYWKRIDAAYPPLEPIEGDETPVVSVIMPVYNTERAYLDESIKSVLNQTRGDFELICINDGSTDDSLDRLVAWEVEDERIHVRSQPNQGLSAARNSGLSVARGTYVLFLDSDDMLREDALEVLVAKANADELDVLDYGACASVEEGFDDKNNLGSYYVRNGNYEGVQTGLELMLAQLALGEYRSSACLHLIRRSALDRWDLRFIRGIHHEDNPFTFELMLRAGRVSYLNEAFYVRRVHEDSIMTRPTTFANAFGYYRSYRAMLGLFLTMADDLDPLTYEMLSRLVMSMLLAARREYGAMPAEQVGSHHGVGRYRNEFFHDVVKTRLADQRAACDKQMIRNLEQENKALTAQVDSRAHRVGVLLATPLRMSVDAVRWLRQR